MEPKLKHDFTNNCLRIEILQKLILEKLDKGETLDGDTLADYLSFLKEQLSYLHQMNVT